MMMVLTLLLISLTVALPDIYTAGQRAREEELIFRGNEYARAILLYHRQFNKFPQTVDDLLKRTNGYRFLRHPYPDPMTRSGKWRFIHANAAGVVFDSKTLTPPPQKTGQGATNTGNTSTDQANAPGLANLTGQASSSEQAGPTTGQSQQETGSAGNEVKGAFIVGVASTSTHKSIRVWNSKERYDLWEFLGIVTTAAPAGSTPAPSGTTSPGGQQTTGTSGTQAGNASPMNPQN